MNTNKQDHRDTTAAAISITAPIVASHNRYLVEQSDLIRAKTIPWEGYQRANLITEEELYQIRQFEKSPQSSLANAGDAYIVVFVNLLLKLIRIDTLQSILVTIDDFLTSHPETAGLFFRVAQAKGDPSYPFIPFVKLLHKDDEYIQLKAAKILAFLIVEAELSPIYDVSEFMNWIFKKMDDANQNVVDIAIQLLQSLLSIPDYKTYFYFKTNGPSIIMQILQKSTNAQTQYQIIYIMWLLTFELSICEDLQRTYNVLPVFHDIAKSALKEKVVRVIISTLKNLLVQAPAPNVAPMLGNKILPTIENLCGRKWSDSDINEDLEFIKQELENNTANLSTFDVYAAEVISGKLEWSPPHLSNNFWKSNIARFQEKDRELLKILISLLTTSSDPLVLAVAANDLGQYVKFAPNGKAVWNDLGAKTLVMGLMNHRDEKVRYQALIAVQKYMAHAFE